MRNCYVLKFSKHARDSRACRPAGTVATSRESVSEKIADADLRGNVWLAKARRAEDGGNQARADECYRKGNYWLDRSNKLRGQC